MYLFSIIPHYLIIYQKKSISDIKISVDLWTSKEDKWMLFFTKMYDEFYNQGMSQMLTHHTGGR